MQIKIPYVPNVPIDGDFNLNGKRGKPILFQVVDGFNRPLYGVLLALHVNPSSFNEGFTKSKNVVQTYGGFVEWHWPDELDTVSARQSTGAFIGPEVGLTAADSRDPGTVSGSKPLTVDPGRNATIAYERYEDLKDLFRSNGAVYNGRGQPVIQGRVMMITDRGIYIGRFTNFEVSENAEKPFNFELTWEFKVEEVTYNFPQSPNTIEKAGFRTTVSPTPETFSTEGLGFTLSSSVPTLVPPPPFPADQTRVAVTTPSGVATGFGGTGVATGTTGS